VWDIPTVTTAVVDNKRRIRIPSLKPGEVLAYQDNGNDTYTLTKVKAAATEPFPEGSLKQYAEERDEEFDRFVQKTVIGLPK
jgi:hypothetical protein